MPAIFEKCPKCGQEDVSCGFKQGGLHVGIRFFHHTENGVCEFVKAKKPTGGWKIYKSKLAAFRDQCPEYPDGSITALWKRGRLEQLKGNHKKGEKLLDRWNERALAAT